MVVTKTCLGLEPINALCKKNRIPNQYKELALLSCEFHTHVHRAFELRKQTLLKVLKLCDAYRRPERFQLMLLCSKADSRGRTGHEQEPYPQAAFFSELLRATQNIDTKAIVAEGFRGKEVGLQVDIQRTEIIKKLRETVKKQATS
jgi:tRNA nucleotidyltransferase (CCA-adding enzyme)